MERITRNTLEIRCANFNRRIALSGRHLEIGLRNGYAALDEYEGESCQRTIIVGTKREIADFLHAMMTGFDYSTLILDEAVA